MTGDSLSYLWDETSPADWFVKFPLKQCADIYGLPFTGVIDRPDLQEVRGWSEATAYCLSETFSMSHIPHTIITNNPFRARFARPPPLLVADSY